MSLKIEEVAAQRSFVFLWCGSCEGLDLGRQVGICIHTCYVYSHLKNILHSVAPNSLVVKEIKLPL